MGRTTSHATLAADVCRVAYWRASCASSAGRLARRCVARGRHGTCDVHRVHTAALARARVHRDVIHNSKPRCKHQHHRAGVFMDGEDVARVHGAIAPRRLHIAVDGLQYAPVQHERRQYDDVYITFPFTVFHISQQSGVVATRC